MAEKNLDYYLNLPYTVEVIQDRDEDGEGYLFARVIELPGCITQADDYAELGEMIEDAKIAWLETALEDGDTIPEPRPVDDYSGKFVVRIPKSLHRDLAQTAEKEGVSLNALASVALARSVSQAPTVAAAPALANNSPRPFWPQLSDGAWRAMIAAGHMVEAATVNEEMFANWLVNNLQQVEAAIANGSFLDAQHHLNICRDALRICSQHSPVMQVFELAVTMLNEKLNEVAELQTGIIHQTVVQSKMRMQVQTRSQQITSRQIGQRGQTSIGVDFIPESDEFGKTNNEALFYQVYKRSEETYE